MRCHPRFQSSLFLLCRLTSWQKSRLQVRHPPPPTPPILLSTCTWPVVCIQWFYPLLRPPLSVDLSYFLLWQALRLCWDTFPNEWTDCCVGKPVTPVFRLGDWVIPRANVSCSFHWAHPLLCWREFVTAGTEDQGCVPCWTEHLDGFDVKLLFHQALFQFE